MKESKHNKYKSIAEYDEDFYFTVELTESKLTSYGILCTFTDPPFVSVPYVYKSQTTVSSSSTQAEMMSLDTHLKMKGLSESKSRDSEVKILDFLTIEYDNVLRVNVRQKSSDGVSSNMFHVYHFFLFRFFPHHEASCFNDSRDLIIHLPIWR